MRRGAKPGAESLTCVGDLPVRGNVLQKLHHHRVGVGVDEDQGKTLHSGRESGSVRIGSLIVAMSTHTRPHAATAPPACLEKVWERLGDVAGPRGIAGKAVVEQSHVSGEGLGCVGGLQGVAVPGREDKVATVGALDERPCARKWDERMVEWRRKLCGRIASLHSMAAFEWQHSNLKPKAGPHLSSSGQ